MTTPNPKLNQAQRDALAALHADPAAFVEPATLSKLRKLGLVGKHVEKPSAQNGYRQKTTSPVTDAGRTLLNGPKPATPPDVSHVPWVEVDLETMPDGSAPVRLSRSIRVF